MTTDLQVCSKNLYDGTEYKKMGTNFLNSCQVNLSDFISEYESESYNYEVYIQEKDGTYS